MLNQDQEKMAESEVGASAGTVKSYVVVMGHPPIMDLMTLNVAPLS